MEVTQSRQEEFANSLSHGLMLLLGLFATPTLIASAREQGETFAVVGAAVFAGAMALLYFTSTLYHALPASRAKALFQLLDHSAIYLMIAGTYTPFTLGVLRGRWGWMLLGLIWGLALLGLVFKLLTGTRYGKISTGLYILMGWSVLVVIKPLWEAMPGWGIFWLVAGGLAYTGGVVYYATDHVRYNHFRWHLFVIAGTGCHFIAVLKYAA